VSARLRANQWTRDGKLRQPVFVGLREDKDPKQVVREA
jgi:bifunctional non-homologous end joining protein LigD